MEFDSGLPETAQMEESTHHDQVRKCKEDQVSSTSENDANLIQARELTQQTKDIQNGEC